eukprot:scaffold1869_cov163-Ochromonas_danica.AAC.3
MMSSDIQAKPTSVNRPSRETILTAEAVKRAVQQGQLDEEKAKRIMDSWMDIEKEKNGTTDAATKDELFKKKLGTLFGPMKMKEYFELIIAGRAKVLDDVHKRRLERDEQARMQQQQQMQRQQLQQHQQQSTYQAHSINPSSQSAQNTLPNQSAKLQHPQSQMSGGEIPNYGSAPILQVQPPPISTIPSSSTQPHIQANVISKPTRPQVVNPPIYSPQMSNQNPASVGGPAASSFAPYNPTTLRPNPTTSAPTNYSFYAPSGTASTTELQVKREGEQKINNSFAKILDNKALAPVPQPEQTISANKYKEKSNGKEDSNASTDVVVVSSSTVNSATVKEEEQRPKAVPRTINSGVSAGTVNTLSSSNLSAASSTSALSQSWQYFHLVDRPMMQLGLASCVGGGGLKNMTPGAQQALSEALQLHFKYIIETGIRQTKRRNNLGTIDIYRGLLRSMVGRIGDKVGDDYSSTIGLKWGPPVAEILKQEEEQIAALCTETLQREEQTLKEQMMEYDEERAKVIGAKKKGGSSGDIEPPWWSQDDAAEKKGLLSWEQWVDVAQRAEIATRCQLGPGVNKRRRPGKEDGGHGANHSASALSSSSLADSRRVDGSSTEPESRFQLQKCPLKIENRSNVVSYDDVIAAISRYHASNNGGASSDKSLAEPLGRSIARWKLRSSHS